MTSVSSNPCFLLRFLKNVKIDNLFLLKEKKMISDHVALLPFQIYVKKRPTHIYETQID